MISLASTEPTAADKQVQVQQANAQYEEYIKSIDLQYQNEMDREANRLRNISGQMQESLLQFGNLKEEESKNRQAVVETAKIASTLQDSIDQFNAEISKMEQKTAALEAQIRQKEQKIALLSEDRLRLNTELETQKKVVLDLLQTLQISDKEFTGPKELETALTFIFTDASVSESIQDKKALLSVAKKSREIFYELDTATTKVTDANLTLQKESASLEVLKQQLEEEKAQLEAQKSGKEQLLVQTQNSEAEYQKLWKVSDEQMQESAIAVRGFKDESVQVQQKLQELELKRKLDKNLVSKERIQQIIAEEGPVSVEELGKRFALEDSQNLFLWPVEPKQGVSAYFKDPSYRKHFGQDHNAIDIPTAQGTEIHAPAPAYVYKVVDNGYGYSYIILLHKNNMRTVYGHVSKILVAAGDIVREGQVIGKSGGIPGTLGAGTMTTGAHLHFEVLKGDEYQNPLEYLSLAVLKQYESGTPAPDPLAPLASPVPVVTPKPEATVAPSIDSI